MSTGTRYRREAVGPACEAAPCASWVTWSSTSVHVATARRRSTGRCSTRCVAGGSSRGSGCHRRAPWPPTSGCRARRWRRRTPAGGRGVPHRAGGGRDLRRRCGPAGAAAAARHRPGAEGGPDRATAPDQWWDRQARPRLPGRDPRRATVPVRHLAPAGDRRAAGRRPRPRGLRRSRRSSAAARGDRPPAGAVPRGDRRARRGAGDPRHPAGARPGDPGAGQPRRRGRGRGARLPARARRLRVVRREGVPVPVDVEGLVVDQLPASTRLVFTTPSHQFPYGPPLSLDRRRALLDFAGRHRCAHRDNYDSFPERPLEHGASPDAAGRPPSATFSKSLGAPFGYLVAPEPLQDASAPALQLSVGYVARAQAAWPRFLGGRPVRAPPAQGAGGVRRTTQVVLEVVTARCSAHLDPPPCQAGLHITLAAARPVGRRRRRGPRAAEEGLVVEALSSSTVGGHRAPIVLGYGAATPRVDQAGSAAMECVLATS